uniref:Cystatin-1 n=1 Tax=Chilobrachys guangxiensis TaxID=278060 RepID=CYT_CHIGU|nr:RecName: Full=Cystatin-1; AltName: Full=Cystatin JZTX-75; Flags: Precursor [Chilobrachys guangxiensis]ABY71743.1 cystatin-like peptide [Chilobrachys guangxiensis]
MKAIYLILTVLCGFSASTKTGGWRDKDVDDEDIRKFATLAASENSKMSNSLYFEKLVKVIEAKSQVVSGVKYNITFEIAPTECKKNGKGYDKLSECPLLESAPHQTCTAIIWTRSWLNDTQILKLKCKEGGSSC